MQKQLGGALLLSNARSRVLQAKEKEKPPPQKPKPSPKVRKIIIPRAALCFPNHAAPKRVMTAGALINATLSSHKSPTRLVSLLSFIVCSAAFCPPGASTPFMPRCKKKTTRQKHNSSATLPTTTVSLSLPLSLSLPPPPSLSLLFKTSRSSAIFPLGNARALCISAAPRTKYPIHNYSIPKRIPNR